MDKKTIKKELETLIEKGDSVYYASVLAYDDHFLLESGEEIQIFGIEALNKIHNPQEEYQIWYRAAYKVVQFFAPEKLPEFEDYYNNYIKTWLIALIEPSLQDAYFKKFEAGFRTQIFILTGIVANFDNSILNLERDIHLGIYKSAMDLAKDIQQEDPRIAGAIASVVLEVHLKKLAVKNGIEDKENNSIATYNNFLKRKGVYDSILADQIKPCREIRNKCLHTNKGDPNAGEVSSIIHIADRLTNEYN